MKSYWILTCSRLPEGNSTSERLNKCFFVLLRVWTCTAQKYLNRIEEEKTCFHASLSLALPSPFINLSGLILLMLFCFLSYFLFLYWIQKWINFITLCNIQHTSGNRPLKEPSLGSADKHTTLLPLAWPKIFFIWSDISLNSYW